MLQKKQIQEVISPTLYPGGLNAGPTYLKNDEARKRDIVDACHSEQLRPIKSLHTLN